MTLLPAKSIQFESQTTETGFILSTKASCGILPCSCQKPANKQTNTHTHSHNCSSTIKTNGTWHYYSKTIFVLYVEHKTKPFQWWRRCNLRKKLRTLNVNSKSYKWIKLILNLSCHIWIKKNFTMSLTRF